MELTVDGVMEIRLPARLDREALARFRADVERLDGHRAAVLRGADGTVFCRGVDFEGIDAMDEARREAGLDDFLAAAQALVISPVPTIACVRGDAMGGGLGIAAACDVVLAEPAARFALPELLFGLIPGLVLPLLRSRVSGPAIRRLAIGGESIDTLEARRLGLVDEVVPPEEMESRLAAWIRRARRAEPAATGRLKRWLAEIDGLAPAMARGRDHLSDLLADDVVRARVRRYEQGLVPWEEEPDDA